MISKKDFVLAIESIRSQIIKDRLNAEALGDMFPGSELAMYNNSLLIKQIISLLSIWFPREELEHYCFEKNFGKVGDQYESADEFYSKLINNI